MACAMLHNVCIVRNDPCKPRWCLTVDKLEYSKDSKVTESQMKMLQKLQIGCRKTFIPYN